MKEQLAASRLPDDAKAEFIASCAIVQVYFVKGKIDLARVVKILGNCSRRHRAVSAPRAANLKPEFLMTLSRR